MHTIILMYNCLGGFQRRLCFISQALNIDITFLLEIIFRFTINVLMLQGCMCVFFWSMYMISSIHNALISNFRIFSDERENLKLSVVSISAAKKKQNYKIFNFYACGIKMLYKVPCVNVHQTNKSNPKKMYT